MTHFSVEPFIGRLCIFKIKVQKNFISPFRIQYILFIVFLSSHITYYSTVYGVEKEPRIVFVKIIDFEFSLEVWENPLHPKKMGLENACMLAK